MSRVKISNRPVVLFGFAFAEISDGKLTCSIEQQFESALTPVGEHAFDVEQAGGAIITFSVEANIVTGLSLKNAGREIVLKKMEAK